MSLLVSEKQHPVSMTITSQMPYADVQIVLYSFAAVVIRITRFFLSKCNMMTAGIFGAYRLLIAIILVAIDAGAGSGPGQVHGISLTVTYLLSPLKLRVSALKPRYCFYQRDA